MQTCCLSILANTGYFAQVLVILFQTTQSILGECCDICIIYGMFNQTAFHLEVLSDVDWCQTGGLFETQAKAAQNQMVCVAMNKLV